MGLRYGGTSADRAATDPGALLASAAERNWSVYGQIMTPARSRMKHERGDKLVYCHEALHLRAKLMKAGYVQKPVKWDTDSDSDETDEADEADELLRLMV